jgi:hypothetical protein
VRQRQPARAPDLAEIGAKNETEIGNDSSGWRYRDKEIVTVSSIDRGLFVLETDLKRRR